jgi:CheY-like chemotaxis protein
LPTSSSFLNLSVPKTRSSPARATTTFCAPDHPVPLCPELLRGTAAGERTTSMSGRAHILVADDSSSVRHLLRRILETEGFAISEAADGVAALHCCLHGNINLVIIDLVMPEKEGLETIRILRHDYPDLPIIAISGVLDETYLRMAKFLGAQCTFSKPLHAETLVAEIRRLLPASHSAA